MPLNPFGFLLAWRSLTFKPINRLDWQAVQQLNTGSLSRLFPHTMRCAVTATGSVAGDYHASLTVQAMTVQAMLAVQDWP